LGLKLAAALTQLLSIIGWKRLAVTGVCLVVWRAIEQVPVSSLNQSVINVVLYVPPSTFLHDIGTAVPFERFSIAAVGVQPYVIALVVLTLAPAISKRVQAIASSPDGMARLHRWARALTVLIAMGQAYGWTVLYEWGNALPPMDWSARLAIILELAGGTMVLVWLGDLLDEYGLGFGHGAILIYALGPLAGEVHRLAAIAASSPSREALYRPLGIWTIVSIGVVVASVAVLLALRRVRPIHGKKSRAAKSVELRILLSGVLRPPLFANAVLSVPVIFANYFVRTNPGAAAWVVDHLTVYGSNTWTDAAYAFVDVCLVIGFTYFVVACDFKALQRELTGHVRRLTFIGGSFLALIVVVLPILEWNAARVTGGGIPMNGFDAVLVTTMIVFILRTLELSRKLVTGPPVLMSPVP
jgi:preprotein translocase subunit SecY